MFNKVILVGNLTKDIELRYLQSGTAVAKTGIAVNRKYTLNGVKKEEVCFIDLDFFGKTAEIANQYLKKGSRILVEGRLKFDQWQDQNGQNRSKHSISVENMTMLSGNASNEGGSQNNYQQNSTSYNQNSYNKNYNKDSSSNYNSQTNEKIASKEKSYNDTIPDVDIDADQYDNDEEIPF